jgi:sortase A
MKRVLAFALVLVGVAAIGNGTWIHVKARLAQVLLRNAWQRTLAGAQDAKPWPWADTRPVARLVIERTKSDFIVLEGSNGRALAFAPGHLEQTPLPGQPGNCVVSAHRDTHFAALRHLQRGDVVRMQRGDGRWVEYRVDDHRVVHERDTWVTRGTDASTLTLITCYPFEGVVGGEQRYVVVASPLVSS